MNNKKVRLLTTSSMIAAVYLVLTLIFYLTSFFPYQIRFAEALTVLPYFTPMAIPGLFVGCLVSNILGGNGIWDIAIGSISTLAASYLTYKVSFNRPKRKLLAPLPPVIINAVAVGAMLSVLYELPVFMTMLSVGGGQVVACYLLGYPLMLLIERNKKLKALFDKIN
ncbi:putative membrane protein [Ruminiclostridium sufflavum DSM 19573]|uniref:Putative membrane protein n=1 Tax=Ruminiclostridium sufflavum DSM 19573 TaxID=1121337 RepID=A0A318XM11_9FIRM|nr:QueT transporter family protein [Ruminiclostridium sufflavum]PYG88762.1 putative membrane protein [Ruminiclostridium sufflavum DSM 19573]